MILMINEAIMTSLIERPEYLNFLISWKDQKVIKVISGIRRCGKSTLFELYKSYLLSCGVQEKQIIAINFEDADFDYLCEYKALYEYIKSKMLPDKMNYIFLDEIQHVENFQKAIDSLFIKDNADVYITGSNAFFMSSELATLLTGRYVELKMLPFSFKEYYGALSDSRLSKDEIYSKYITESSFPFTVGLKSKEQIRQYLDGIFNTVVLNDIINRNKISDSGMLKSVMAFMFDNIGSLTSPKKIADTLTSMNRKISNHTVESYLSAITDSLLMYKVGRYDIKGKQYLQMLDKYYLADIGLRYYLLGNNNVDRGHILENVIYLELIRRGYEVYVDKIGNTEVDFIAKDSEGSISYYQVSYSVKDEKTLDRELKSLESIKDHNRKFLLTMDHEPLTSHNGIQQINALDWLLS